MEGKRLIEKIRLRNILSFGDKGEEVELQPLNVLIGQNASGKSNLVDITKLLRALPAEKGLSSFISRNGGISEWIWKGKKEQNIVEVKVVFNVTNKGLISLYEIAFKEDIWGIDILTERIEAKTTNEYIDREQIDHGENSTEKLSASQSMLWKIYRNTPMTLLDETKVSFSLLEYDLSRIKIFSDLQTNRSTEIRKPQVPDSSNDFLAEDASNLSLVLNDLEHRGNTKDIIVENLRKFNPRVKDYSVKILGGTVQLFIREENLERPISAMRLSDGTLRYLCLLAILCHPEPPPLICIEEPEIGLHPDILPTIGELLIEASKRTQLIVTTHSDILVSALSEVPEAVLVCEADSDGTHLRRLEPDKLKSWLEEYDLGNLWIRGEIGGKRW